MGCGRAAASLAGAALLFTSLLLLLAGSVVPLCAQSAPLVVSIAVQPPPDRPESQFIGRVSQQINAPASPVAIRQSIERLFASGEFATVRAVEYPATGGVRLVFETTPNYFNGTVRVFGAPSPATDSELFDASGLEPGKLYSPDEVSEAGENIQARLRSYGYYQAKVSAKTVLQPGSQARITLLITAGPLARVGTVRVLGATLLPANALLAASRLKPGQKLTQATVQKALSRIQSYYAKRQHLAARVRLLRPQYHRASNRADLTIKVDAGPQVSISAEGAKVGRRTLKREVPVFQEHAADAELIEEGRANLQNYFQSKGYFQARVDYERRQPSSSQLNIIYLINLGPRETLQTIRFRGNKYFSSDDLRDLVAVRPESLFIPNIIPGGRGHFNTGMMDDDASAITGQYQANGFQDVKVTPVLNRHFQGRKNHLAVTYNIVEGPQTLVRKLAVQGNKAVSTAAIEGLLTTAPQQPYSRVNLATDRDQVLQYYFDHGYLEAHCTTQAIPVKGKNLEDVSFAITEGRQFSVNNVYVSGTRFVKPRVVGQRLSVQAGAPLSQAAMLNTQRRLYRTGVFTDVAVSVENPNGMESRKNVLVSVHEARRYTFTEGVGFQYQSGAGRASNQDLACPTYSTATSDTPVYQGSAGWSPLLSFGVTRLAVTGRPQTLSLDGNYGSLHKRALLSYDIPRFLNDNSLKLDATTLYDDSYDVLTFRAIREEAGLQLEDEKSHAVRFIYHVGYRRADVRNPVVSPAEIPVLSLPADLAEASANFIDDHRDDPLNTHRGMYQNAVATLAKSFGGYADFARFYYENSTYYPFGRKGKFVLARSTRIGFEHPFGPQKLVSTNDPVVNSAGQCLNANGAVVPCSVSSLQYVLPLPERFYSGGPDSLRGFAIDQAGPRDPITGFPIGGNALFINNVEFRYPLLGPNVGGVLFWDAGNVYTTLPAVLHSLLVFKARSTEKPDYTSNTLGVGLRYNTPVGPIRLDLGYNLNPPQIQNVVYNSNCTNPQWAPPTTLKHWNFFFSIGQTF